MPSTAGQKASKDKHHLKEEKKNKLGIFQGKEEDKSDQSITGKGPKRKHQRGRQGSDHGDLTDMWGFMLSLMGSY